MMYCLSLESTDPFFNLAVEEYLLKNRDEDFFILSINDPSVIIGKHQVAHREINTEYITEYGIPVIRRITGGGTVFHDHGNLNFTFIARSTTGKQVDFRKYTLPVIGFLESLGVSADFAGKSDLKVNGYKISGNAEHVYRERVLHHGTLLFSTSLNVLKNSIRQNKSGYTTRAVRSSPSSVMNLCEIIRQIKNINEFRSLLLGFILNYQPGNSITALTEEQISAITALAGSKYRTWEWNYAYGPEYYFTNQFEIRGVQYLCRLDVKDGIIHGCDITGPGVMADICKKLIGFRHMPSDIFEFFRKEGLMISLSEVYNYF